MLKDRAVLVGVVGLIGAIALLGGDRFFPIMSPDFVSSYHPGALSLKRGEGYLYPDGELITHRPPVYSLLLAPLATEDARETLVRARLLLAGLAVVHVLLLAAILARVAPRAPRWAVVPVLALWPPLLPLLNPGGSELAFAVFLDGAVLVVLATANRPARARQILAVSLGGGALLGMASLTRVMGLAAAGAVLLALLLTWRHWSPGARAVAAAGLLASMGLVLLPWALVVRAHTGELSVSSAGPPSMRDGLERFPDLVAGRELADPKTWEGGEHPFAVFSEVAARHPASAAALLVRKSLRPWYGTDSGRHEGKLQLVNLPWLVLTLIAAWRTLRIWDRVPPGVVLLLGVVASCWVAAFLVLSIFRYTAPVFPLAVIGVTWHVTDLWALRSVRTD